MCDQASCSYRVDCMWNGESGKYRLWHICAKQSSQEFVWKRSTSANVSMYELTIKKDEERAATYDVCDKDQVNDIYCRGEVTFVPPDFFFEEGTKYKINVYRLVHSHVMDQDFVLPTFLAVLWSTMVSA